MPYVSGRHLLRVPVDQTTGKAPVSLSGTTTASATDGVLYGVFGNYPGTSYQGYYQQTNGATGANASASIGGTARLDSREVTISCPAIENSNASGPTPDVRSPSGAITVDSAVSWTAQDGFNNTGWEVNHFYYANISSFVNPLYSWSKSGDGTIVSQPVGQQSSYTGIWYFGQSYGNFLNKSTTLTLAVQDGPPSGDGAAATNTYTIRWHYPYENWQQSGPAFQNPPAAYHSTNGPQGAGGQVSIPVSAAKTDWSVAGKVGSGLLAAGAALASGTDPIILCFAAATGSALGSINPPPPPTTYYISGPQSQFQADVATEMSIISGNTSGVFLPGVDRMPQKFANMVSASGNYSGYFNGNSPGSPQGSLTFDATAYRLQWQQNYVGDAYGVKGYTGSASSYVKWEGSWQYVFNWIWTPAGNPGPGK